MPDWQIHEYNANFYILRESGCTNYEKPFLYLIFVLSAACFVGPASAAVIAEPSAWTTPIASGLCLLILNWVYAVFAGFFLNAPLLAALAFFIAVAYAGYESLELAALSLLVLPR